MTAERARHPCRPPLRGGDRRRSPSRAARHPERADLAPGPRSHFGPRRRSGTRREPARRARARWSGPERATEPAGRPPVTPGSRDGYPERGDERGTKCAGRRGPADDHAGPRQHAGRRTQSPARRPRRRRPRHEHDDVERVHRSGAHRPHEQAGVGQEARVATMRWSGRTTGPRCASRAGGSRASRPSPNRALASSSRSVDRPGGSLAGTPAGCRPGRSAASACFTTFHGSGRSRRRGRDRGLPYPLVDVADLDVVALKRAPPRKALHVGYRPLGEVSAQLVAGHVPGRPDRTQQRIDVSAPEPTPDSRTRAPGKISAEMRIGPKSLG